MVNLYFDMDGVLAKWNPNVSTEDTFKKGYFLNREPDTLMVELAKEMRNQPGVRVYILTAVYDNGYAEEEKKQWLINNGLSNFSFINVPYGLDKALAIKQSVKSFLIDDYSVNLHNWEKRKNFVGIKYYNGINGTNGTWTGDVLCYDMLLENAKSALLWYIEKS